MLNTKIIQSNKAISNDLLIDSDDKEAVIRRLKAETRYRDETGSLVCTEALLADLLAMLLQGVMHFSKESAKRFQAYVYAQLSSDFPAKIAGRWEPTNEETRIIIHLIEDLRDLMRSHNVRNTNKPFSASFIKSTIRLLKEDFDVIRLVIHKPWSNLLNTRHGVLDVITGSWRDASIDDGFIWFHDDMYKLKTISDIEEHSRKYSKTIGLKNNEH